MLVIAHFYLWVSNLFKYLFFCGAYQCLEGGDDNASKSFGESLQNNVSSIKGEMEELSEGPQSKTEVKKSNSGSEEKMEDSPVMGLLTAKKVLHSAAEKTQGNGSKANITESTINKAIKKRAAYFRANSEYDYLFLLFLASCISAYVCSACGMSWWLSSSCLKGIYIISAGKLQWLESVVF